MHLKRRDVFFGLLGLSLPLITSSCNKASTPQSASASATGVSGKLPEKIRIGCQVSANSEVLAKGLSLAKKAFPNTQIEYIFFGAGRDVNTAIAARGIDFGQLGSVPVSVGVAQRLPYQVYYLHDVIGKAEALVVRNNIKTVSDLVGKKIAVPFGSTSHFCLLNLLRLEKIALNSLTLLDLLPQDLLAAWQRKDIDGGYIWDPTQAKLLENGGSVLVTSGDLAKRGVVTTDVGVVSQDFAAQYPDAVKKYVGVLDQAVKLYRNDPKAASKAIAPELNVPPEQSLSLMGGVIWLDSKEQATAKYFGTPGHPGDFAQVLKDSGEFMVTQKAIPAAPDLTAYQKSIWNQTLG